MTEDEKRKPFQHLDGKDNPQFLQDACEIYELLKKKYPDKSIIHLDNILNALCGSLVILTLNNVQKDNHKNFLQLIWNILNKNL